MRELDSTWFLVYSANDWDSGGYAIGYAVCDTIAAHATNRPRRRLSNWATATRARAVLNS